MTFRVGLTGGIGSGKSAAAAIFAELGVPVVNADQVAREVVEPGQPALDQIAAHFGASLLDSDGRLDRRQLREIVFNDPAQKRWLEALLHPLIRSRIIDQLGRLSTPYAILESPLLFESGQRELVACAVVVDVDEQTQLCRTTARDGVDLAQARRILAAQMDRPTRRAQADYLIDNSGDLLALRLQVEALHRQLLGRAVGQFTAGKAGEYSAKDKNDD